MEGVPLRFPRPIMSGVAIGLAVVWAAVGSVPALAGTARPARTADQVRQQEWWLNALHVTQAWQTTKGAGVTIALLDTGVDPAQPDLAGSVITGTDFTNSDEKLGGQFFGIHGTAMASLIVGHGHGNGDLDGVAGVAPDAKLLSVRVVLDAGDPLLSESSATSALPAAIAAGIRYAVNNGAQVIDLPLDPGQNLSALTATPAPMAPALGTPTPAETAAAAAAGGSSAEQSAVQYALSKGVILVAPGGDNNTTTDAANFPASYPGVISVGAFNSNFFKAPFSSHQHYVTLTAAGNGVIAAVPSGGYTTVSSTSAASAIVTGIAALIKSQYPELAPAQVSQALTKSTVIRPANGTEDGSGFGTADAARALAEAGTIATPGPPRAGAGAVSNPMPAAPAPPVISDATTAKLRRDGIISLIILAVLLLPTLAYGVMVRRRVRAIAQARAELGAASRVPYAHNAAADVDLMSEYFSPIVGDSEAPGYVRSGGGAAVGTAPSGLLARSVIAANRLTVARPPEVAGAPPWGPAPKPDGELPWMGRSRPSRPRRNVPAHLIPAPTAGKRRAESADSALEEEQAADSGAASAEIGARLYVWNPDSAAEGLPGRGAEDAATNGNEESSAGLGESGAHYRNDPAEDRDATAYHYDDPPAFGDDPAHGETEPAGYSDPDDLTAYRNAGPPAYRDEDSAAYPDQDLAGYSYSGPPASPDQDLAGYSNSGPPASPDQDLAGYSNPVPPAYGDENAAAYIDRDGPDYSDGDLPAYQESEPPAYGGQDTGTYADRDLAAYGDDDGVPTYSNGPSDSGVYPEDSGYRDSAITPGDEDLHAPDGRF